MTMVNFKDGRCELTRRTKFRKVENRRILKLKPLNSSILAVTKRSKREMN